MCSGEQDRGAEGRCTRVVLEVLWMERAAQPCVVVLCRSQTDTEGSVTAEASTGGLSMDSALYVKSAQPALEELSGKSCSTAHH